MLFLQKTKSDKENLKEVHCPKKLKSQNSVSLRLAQQREVLRQIDTNAQVADQPRYTNQARDYEGNFIKPVDGKETRALQETISQLPLPANSTDEAL